MDPSLLDNVFPVLAFIDMDTGLMFPHFYFDK